MPACSQRIGRFPREVHRGTGIHDRKHDLAFGDKPRHRANVGETRLARQGVAALASLVERRAHRETPRFDLHRYGLPHVTGGHQADFFDPHAGAFQGGCEKINHTTVRMLMPCRPAEPLP
ncbi:hypothetical protein D3C83_27970 [compost metagenome]